jgi:hypothetical protein
MPNILRTLTLFTLCLPLTATADNNDFFSNWADMVTKSKEEQPHWITPLSTVTPRLEQEIRFDVSEQFMNSGQNYSNYGAGKGLELIPTENTEVILNLPNYQNRTARNSKGKNAFTGDGWQDESLLTKYRILSANEERGNYIVTAFLGASFPTGSSVGTFSNHMKVYTASLSAGKGWGSRVSGISMISTLGLSDIVGTPPTSATNNTNIPSVTWNTTLQGHYDYFWPEIEINASHFEEGKLKGKNQVLVTYGVILGRFKISEHSNLIIGAGYQNALSNSSSNAFDRGWTSTARITF